MPNSAREVLQETYALHNQPNLSLDPNTTPGLQNLIAYHNDALDKLADYIDNGRKPKAKTKKSVKSKKARR